jgi:hypothetical protein
MNHEFNFSEIVERIRIFLEINDDNEIAEAIKMSPQNLSGRKRSGLVPFKQLSEFATSRNVNYNWLLTGKGQPQLLPDANSEPTPLYSVSNKALKVAELFDHLTESQQREILSAVEEKERLNEISERLRRLEASGDQQQQCA